MARTTWHPRLSPRSTGHELPEACELGLKSAVYDWVGRLTAVDDTEVEAVFERFPDGWISKPAVDFAVDVLETTEELICDAVEADGWNMGYLPRYYTDSFTELLDRDIDYELTVRRHNSEPSYPQHRFLMAFRGDNPSGWSFPQSSLYDVIDATSSAAEVA